MGAQSLLTDRMGMSVFLSNCSMVMYSQAFQHRMIFVCSDLPNYHYYQITVYLHI